MGVGGCFGLGLVEAPGGDAGSEGAEALSVRGADEAALGGGVECGVEAGGGAGVHEGGADRVADEVVDEGGLAETDFGLGGVYVDVDFLGREFEEEEDDGEGCGGDDVAVGLQESGVEDEAVADEAAVGENVGRVAVELSEFGFEMKPLECGRNRDPVAS